MTWTMGWKFLLATGLTVLAVSPLLVANDLFLNLDASGGLDARFLGLEIAASLEGNVEVVGDILCREAQSWISGTGAAFGVGNRDILGLTSTGWILLSISGHTGKDAPVVMRSLLYASHHNLVPLQAGEVFEGVHHTAVWIGDFVDVYQGAFSGTLAGELAPAVIPGTLRLEGRGSFQLWGDRIPHVGPGEFPDFIPLEDHDLSEDFLQAVRAWFSLEISHE